MPRFLRLVVVAFSFVPAAGLIRAQSPPPGPSTLSAHQRLAHDVYKELVETHTVDSVGSVTKAAEAMAARFRAAGFPAYGASGLFMQSGEGNAHGRDEKMRVKSYYEGLEFLDQLVRQVTSAPRP